MRRIRALKKVQAVAIAWLGTFILRMLDLTIKWEVVGQPALESFLSNPNSRILLFWHECQLMLPPAFIRFARLENGDYPDISVLISSHSDGRTIAKVAQNFGLNVVSGSSSRGGAEALINMVRRLRGGSCVAITPDGPRGPRREPKPGAALLAARLAAPILPVGIAASRCWRFNSWDKMFLPKPFSKVVLAIGEPLKIDDRESADKLIGDRLEAVMRLAEERASA